ncbi:MAG: hypothetical protein JNL75_07525 [Chitinophagales bacterium]|nr:hypothetical protein [Chitinophagales bacterium]
MKVLFGFCTLVGICLYAGEPSTHSKNFLASSSAAFEQNLGQIKYPDAKPAPEVKFIYKQGNLKIFLLNDGLAYQLEKYEKDTLNPLSEGLGPSGTKSLYQ